ncbi:MAG: YidB family protein [Melioribacteraceae bacterium]
MDMLKSVLGGGDKNDLMSVVMGLIGGQKGGLSGLVSQFASKGLGDVIGSWVGTGENKAISTDQLQNALGSEKVKDIASKLGVDPNSALSQLSKILPQAVDKLTPDGKVPEGDILSQGMNLLGGLFGKK